MTRIPSSPSSVLSPRILEDCRGRAADYDRENRFFAEDFEQLREAGYLNLAIPEELGGPGYTLAEVVQGQLVAAKHRAVEGSWKVVDAALDVAGGFGIDLDETPRWG